MLRAPRLASSWFDTDRVILPAGAAVPRHTLWPTPDAPPIPVLVECTMSPNARARPGGSETMHILWIYENDVFHEVARRYSKGAEWWADLHPLIVRELARSGSAPEEPDILRKAMETAEYLDRELRDLTDDEQAEMLTLVHDELAGRIARTGRTLARRAAAVA